MNVSPMYYILSVSSGESPLGVDIFFQTYCNQYSLQEKAIFPLYTPEVHVNIIAGRTKITRLKTNLR